MAHHYDAAIIGSGQAGPSLANRLTQCGLRAAIITVIGGLVPG